MGASDSPPLEHRQTAVRILAVLAIVLLNLFILLDLATYPEHLRLFIGLRLLLTAIVLGVLVHQHISRADHTTAHVFIMLVPTILVFALMSNLSGEGYASDYYVGVIYCMVVLMLFPVSTRTLTVLLVVMYATYSLCMHLLFPVPVQLRHLVENHMFMIGIGIIVTCSHWYISRLRERIELANLKNEALLLSILPRKVAEELKETNRAAPERFARVGILFADIVDFTPMAARLPPEELLELLNTIFSSFDNLAASHGCERIKTIGDAYMVACGVPNPVDHCTSAIADLALAMQEHISRVHRKGAGGLQLRVGINEGAVVAGIVGNTKFSYDLWGDAVNMASRMESHGVPGQIQVTPSVFERLRSDFAFRPRGTINVKGVGPMETYFLLARMSVQQNSG
jgi:class 3 adenylate cyclase